MNLFTIVNKYNVYLLIPIFMMSYFGIRKSVAIIRKNSYLARFGEKTRSQNKKVAKNREWMEKIRFIKTANRKLIKRGSPLGLNGYTFYLVKILMFVLCFVMGVRSYESHLMAIIIGTLGFFALDIFIYANEIIRNNSINNDMLNVVDCLYLQMSANMTIGDALRGLHETCENNNFKKELIKLSSEYELSGNNIEKAVEEFKNSFNSIEVDLFASALKQQVLNGNSQEALANLSEILREGYLDRLNMRTKIKSLYIIAGVIIIMVDIIALTMFPIFVDVGEGMKRIFE